MAKRKAAQPPKASTSQSKPAPKAKKARFSNPTPSSLPPPKKTAPPPRPTPKTKIAQLAGPPKKFVISAGSYERLLYGLECTFTQPDKLQVHPIFSFPAHLSSLRTVAASSNPITEESGLGTERKLGGKYLVSGGQDEVIKVWDLQRRKEVGSLEGDTTGESRNLSSLQLTFFTHSYSIHRHDHLSTILSSSKHAPLCFLRLYHLALPCTRLGTPPFIKRSQRSSKLYRPSPSRSSLPQRRKGQEFEDVGSSSW